MRELIWVYLALKRDADALKLARQAVKLSRRRGMRCSVIPIWPALPKSKLAPEPRPTRSQFSVGYLPSPRVKRFPSRA